MWPKSLTLKKDGLILRNSKKYAKRAVNSLVFGKELTRDEGASFAKSSDVKKFLSSSNTGILLNGRDLRLSEKLSFSNTAVYGVTGQGKSTVYARPLILDKAKTNSTLIVNDMKGDLYRDTSGVMKANGYRVIVLNPNDLENSNRYNPFLEIRKDVDLLRYSELFSKLVGKGDGDGEFWQSGGERYIRFFMTCIQRFGAKEFNNPPNLYRILQNYRDNGEDLEEFVAFCVNGDPFLENEWKALTSGAEETVSGFIINALVALKIFSMPHVCGLTATSDTDYSTLRKQKTIIYVITPPEDQGVYRPLISMYFLSFISICMREPPEDNPNLLPVFFVYDEFGNSFIPGFESLITTTRSFGISFLLMMQGINQLVTRYGRDEMSNIMSGITTHISFGSAEPQTADFFSNKIGKKRKFYYLETQDTHVEHHSEYELMSAGEIRELPDNKVLVVCRNYKATLLDVYPSYENSRFKRMMKYKPVRIDSSSDDKIHFVPL